MEIFLILLQQIVLFVIYMGVGVILVKTRVLTEPGLEGLSAFVVKLGLPVMIFVNTIGGVEREVLLQSLNVLGATALMYALLFVLCLGLAKLFRMRGDMARTYRALGMFGNTGFMGIPIISSIYPAAGMLYISLITIVDQLLLWTLGLSLTTPQGGDRPRFRLRKLINTATVAIALAIVLILLEITLPDLLLEALEKIGGTATPLAMIYLGGVFACIDIRKYLRRAELYGIVVIKMLLFPLALYGILSLLPLSGEVQMSLTLLSALPCMTSIVMMAKAGGGETGDYAIGALFVTTVCSIVTLPVVSLILGQITG